MPIWDGLRRDGRITFAGTLTDGRPVQGALTFARATGLPPLDDPEWVDAAARVRAATRRGRDDRLAACRLLGADATCICP